MATSTETFTGVDLSALPAPQVIASLDFIAIRDTALADLASLYPNAANLLPSDPLMKLVELFSYRELLLRAQINDASRALLPALATGGNLDHLAVVVGIARFPDETDESLRIRMARGPEQFSVAGPVGAYIALATAAHSDIAFVSVTSPSPANVVIAVQSFSNNGTAPAPVLAAVASAVNAETKRPIADRVTILPAAMIVMDIEATIATYPNAPVSSTLAASRASVEAFFAVNARLGRDITTDAILSALRVAGVSKATLASPVTDAVVTDLQAIRLGALVINHGGVSG